MNIALILAAGNSSRFSSDTFKQLYPINEKPIIDWSIDIISKFFTDIIIVTNSSCIIKTNHKIVINDIDNRITSIKSALDTISDKPYNNILIHDAARPFISEDYILKLLESSKHYKHSQYYLPLVNGLARKSELGWEIAPRENFIELCTPQITDFNLFKEIFYNYIDPEIQCEILTCLSHFKLDPNLIKGHSKYLRKITTIDDIY
jgi:2-C-methyl-D-erythritol 4-phosphate cytidylyltransferase/2-C-methyl-D-erythritol 2,4-cyclodiphosphate synthase